MERSIRLLHSDDYPLLETMDTGIEDDYVKRVFHRLSTGDNRLYGLFLGDQLVSLGGINIYAKRYAMLGRLRSDRRFRGQDFATKVMTYMLKEAFLIDGIQWVGANTQEENVPARRVMEKIGFSPYTMLHGALTDDTTTLTIDAKPWKLIDDLQRKKDWLQQTYVDSSEVFPYECYYLFPASEDLFQDEKLREWSFYENEEKNRFLITKIDQKKYHYLHVIYPWNDMTEQVGLWETITADYKKLLQQNGEETYIWMDLSKEEASSLPSNHQFTLPSPWILYGMNKEKWDQLKMCQALVKN
ncbi:GNAT family N-acetyltransferase [Ornithinibacillus salinisoli]|uniref:GNAT family N-acetyltransferase n=1 Tax=Ornithinibacillus salinisoli TaxID=1848459 RepID=A0ABW4W375_9BACI